MTQMLVNHYLQNSSSFEGGYAPLNTQYLNYAQQTTPSHQFNGRHSKHLKAYSMVQSTRAGNGHPVNFSNAEQQQQQVTQQYLNQPLQLNQRILNQTIQYPNNGPCLNPMVNYSTIGQGNMNDINNYFS